MSNQLCPSCNEPMILCHRQWQVDGRSNNDRYWWCFDCKQELLIESPPPPTTSMIMTEVKGMTPAGARAFLSEVADRMRAEGYEVTLYFLEKEENNAS